MNEEKRATANRAKAFALRVIRLYAAVPGNGPGDVIRRQLLRSATSIGAHCREGFRSRSTAEAISKLEVALQEADETSYWLELLIEAEIMRASQLQPLLDEVEEITRILVASVRTMKRRRE